MAIQAREKKHATPADLAAEVALLIDVVRAAPAEKLQLSVSTQWGAREILSHLVFWHAHYVKIFKALLAKRRPELPTDSFKSLNAYSVVLYSTCAIDEMLASLERSQRCLDDLGRRARISKVRFSFREGSKERSYPEFLDDITHHFRTHRSQIERLVKARARREAAGSAAATG